MISSVDNKLRYSIDKNNRDIVASICVNELNAIKQRVEFTQDRQMLNAMINHCERQIGKDMPMELCSMCNVYETFDDACCNYDCGACGRVIYMQNPRIQLGTVTIDMLADETKEFIENASIEDAPLDGKQYVRKDGEWVVMKSDLEMDKPLVRPTLTVTWTNKRTGSTSNYLSISSEIGDIYNWAGLYMWASRDNYKDPQSIVSNVFNTLTEDGVPSEIVQRDTAVNVKYNVTLKADKIGYEVVGDKVVPATGEDETTVSSDITFLYPIYYGVKGNLKKQLVNSANLSITNITTGSDEYFTYKYPSNYPKLTTITMNDAYNVTQAFNYTEEQIISDTGMNLIMRVYTAANPGAFTNAKLNFK